VRVLAVDTTTPNGSAALLEDGRLLAEIGVEAPAARSARLLGWVDTLLKARSLDIRDVEGFAVSVGPGSFTGIRIGLSAVKALSAASGRPIAPVSTLDALALKLASSGDGLVCPFLDAKKGEVYAALYEAEGGRPAEIIPAGAFAPDAFLRRLPADRVVTFIGSGWSAYGSLVEALLGSRARVSSRTPFIAPEIGRLGTEALAAGRGLAADRVEPLYLRRSQAEVGH
jgi:tRNA threonylcarbamoyladenosine biosynthesis protein TsaB